MCALPEGKGKVCVSEWAMGGWEAGSVHRPGLVPVGMGPGTTLDVRCF